MPRRLRPIPRDRTRVLLYLPGTKQTATSLVTATAWACPGASNRLLCAPVLSPVCSPHTSMSADDKPPSRGAWAPSEAHDINQILPWSGPAPVISTPVQLLQPAGTDEDVTAQVVAPQQAPTRRRASSRAASRMLVFKTSALPSDNGSAVETADDVHAPARRHRAPSRASSRSSLISRSVTDIASVGKSFVADDPLVRDRWVDTAPAGAAQPDDTARPISVMSPTAVKGICEADLESKRAAVDAKLIETVALNARPTKLIFKQYAQGLVYSMFTAAVNIPLVYGFSRVKWHEEHPGERPAFTLNRHTFEISLLFQSIFPLSLYSLVLYACIKSTWKLPRNLVIFTACSICLSVMVAVLFWRYDVAFWYYSGDFIYIALSYVPSMCAVGWFLAEEGSTTKERLADLLMVAVLETVVAAAALLYCMYLMPLFYMLTAWVQLAWMMILHPIYFEITTAFLLRIVLRRNALKGRHQVQWFLSIIHASVHSTTISCILTSSIDTFGVTILTQVLCSAAKLVWRSTTNLRDIWAERLLKWDFKFSYAPEEQAVQNRLVAVGIQTEMILENASNILAPWLIVCTVHVPLFMSVAPNYLVDGGTYPVYYVILLIGTLVMVTATFDLSFLFLNYHSWQELPVIQTWREIRKAGWWYFGFLTYALTFMGFMFLFITMILVPRAIYCTSDNYCDCKMATLQGICDGQFISTWGGNII